MEILGDIQKIDRGGVQNQRHRIGENGLPPSGCFGTFPKYDL